MAMTLLTADQQAIRDLAREFAAGEIAPRAADWDRNGAFDRDVLDRLAELGFLGMLVPERYGGLELDLPTYLVAFEELARGDAALALTLHIQNGPVPYVLMTHGTDEQKSAWLPELASGARIAGFALSEAGAGSDPASMTTTARRTDGGWTISGAKKWVTNGGRADVMLVFARTGDVDSGRNPIGAFLVDRSSPGYRVGKRERTMGLRASETVEVELDDVQIAADRLVGDPARGLGYALEALDLGRLGIGAQAVGIASAALEHAIGYARERRQFGRPIAAFGAIRSKLAVMATRIAAARALVMDGARAWETRDVPVADAVSVTARSAMAKLMASETAGLVTEEAVRIFGGYGFMREYPVEKLMRDAKATEIYEGTSEILRLVIGRSLTA
ncbi:MAG: acyl-CoA dehydrogenase [Gemmatimonadetes bacterium]|nr:acyl-CoA dehydrogenase [Gemmatimonadota bacterium]MYG35126.1 acyl-CoA dehydrogenase [Gemmatimonadota bacterium]